MHYTSPENIHRVIEPLFLDDLKAELENILTDDSLGERAKRNQLHRFHDKIASLTFLKLPFLIRYKMAARSRSRREWFIFESESFRK